MGKQPVWNDSFWLLLMQVYQKKPVGVKPLYSKDMVNLALRIHIPPETLYKRMFLLRQINTPRMEKLWEEYGNNKRKLTREVSKLLKMDGFGKADTFYEGVEVNESWEKDFRPISADSKLTPVMLIIVLDLYFRLTPITMVPETQEIIELSRLLRVKPAEICEVMDVFQFCDPYLSHDDMMIHPLLVPCQEIWQRYGNDDPEVLAALAAQLKEYFK